MRISHPQEYITLQGYRMRETDAAILFEIHQIDGEDWEPDTGIARKMWFPLSQMRSQDYNTRPTNEYDTITISKWIAGQKGLV
jgi:hypothetical protein